MPDTRQPQILIIIIVTTIIILTIFTAECVCLPEVNVMSAISSECLFYFFPACHLETFLFILFQFTPGIVNRKQKAARRGCHQTRQIRLQYKTHGRTPTRIIQHPSLSFISPDYSIRGSEDDGAMSTSMSQPWDDNLPFQRDEFVRVISSCLKGLGYG